jgi:hypothetical protein
MCSAALSIRHCEERSDAAIQQAAEPGTKAAWIASLRSQ